MNPTVETVPNFRWRSEHARGGGGRFLRTLRAGSRSKRVAFFDGASLRPLPPVESTQPKVRYLHIHEGDAIDEQQLAAWVTQASKLPGWGVA